MMAGSGQHGGKRQVQVRRRGAWANMEPAYARRVIASELPDLVDWLLEQPSGYPCLNVLERILREPGRTNVAGHRILHRWPPRRLQQINQAFSRIERFGQVVILVKYGFMRLDDGAPATDRDRADAVGLTLRDFDTCLARAKEAIHQQLVMLDGCRENQQNQ